MERRLTAILSADVVGYSRLMEVDEAGTLGALKAHRKELIHPAIDEHHGRIVKLMGDGTLVEFASVVDAVTCAVAIQTGMAERNDGVPADNRIEFRIGVHLGDIIVEDDDIYGDGVNVAARLEGLAEPGGICLSQQAYDQVETKLDLQVEDLGEQQVKNIARPVHTFRVMREGEAPRTPVAPTRRGLGLTRYAGLAVVVALIVVAVFVGWWRPWQADIEPAATERMAHALPDKPSVAVLPFDNMSGDREQDYFADGLIDDLITDLSKVSGLFVIARNSTFTYKGKAVKVQQVAEDLGVRYVVEGSVRRAGDKLRINVQLIDALSGHHLWAERYDGTMADIFDLQDRITRKIVTALALKLVPGEAKTTLRHKGTSNPVAYDAVLRGWNYLRLRRNDPENYVLARQQFERALRLDPNYSRAHLSMAAVYWWSRQFVRMGVNFQEGFDLAKSYLKTAMKTPSALGHRIRAEMYRREGQFDKAIAEADRAITLDPNNPEGYGAKASAQTAAGQAALALKNLDIADRLDPENLHPNWNRRGKAYFVLGNNEKAAQIFELAISATPKRESTYKWLIAAYGHLGRKAEAKAAIKKLNEIRMSKGRGRYTLEKTVSKKLKRDKDKEYFRLGLRKAGLEPGGDLKSTELAWDTIVSRTTEGEYKVQGATIVDAKQAKALLDQGVVIFDVRSTGRWWDGHVKGAFHADTEVGEFTEENLAKFVKKTQPVVFYCGGFT